VCGPDIKVFYDLNKEIIWRNQDLLGMAASHPAGSKIFASGRLVVLRDSVSSDQLFHSGPKPSIALSLQSCGLAEKGVTCHTWCPNKSTTCLYCSGVGRSHHKVWCTRYRVYPREIPLLKLCTDTELASLPPLWITNPRKLIVEERTYDVKAVPISSIVRVCNRVIKVQWLIYPHFSSYALRSILT
jgi:antiviral helicase SKI2